VRTGALVMTILYILVMAMLWCPEIISVGSDAGGIILLGFYKYLYVKTNNQTFALLLCGSISGILTLILALMIILSKKIEELEEEGIYEEEYYEEEYEYGEEEEYEEEEYEEEYKEEDYEEDEEYYYDYEE